MTLASLASPLAVAEARGLDATDPRLDAIATLVQQGDYEVAASRCSELAEQGIFDVRLIVYQLYGYFLERGPAGLGEVFATLQQLLGDDWDALGPGQKFEKAVQTSLDWLFRHVFKHLNYETTRQGDTWTDWLADTGVEDVERTLEAASALPERLRERLGDAAPPLIDSFSKVDEWLQSFRSLVKSATNAELDQADPGDNASASSATKDMSGVVSPPSIASSVFAETSYPLAQLLRKLAAFERLIEQEKFPRAALLADDINYALANFDPRVFLPHLFSRYSELVALHVGELNNHIEQRGSVEWLALSDLLKVDIERFVDL